MKISDIHVGDELAYKAGAVSRKVSHNLDFTKVTVIEVGVEDEKRVYDDHRDVRGRLTTYRGVRIRFEVSDPYHQCKEGDTAIVEARNLLGYYKEENEYRQRVNNFKKTRETEREDKETQAGTVTKDFKSSGINVTTAYEYQSRSDYSPRTPKGVTLSFEDAEKVLDLLEQVV